MEVTFRISDRMQVRIKEGLLDKCFKRYKHLTKQGERRHLPFKSLKMLGTGIFCIPEKLCAKKMHRINPI